MDKNINYNGIGFLGMLQILFIGLKLGNVIDWSWFWVMSPTIIPSIIVIVIVIVLAIITACIKE